MGSDPNRAAIGEWNGRIYKEGRSDFFAKNDSPKLKDPAEYQVSLWISPDLGIKKARSKIDTESSVDLNSIGIIIASVRAVQKSHAFP